jgi:hypothetical protein
LKVLFPTLPCFLRRLVESNSVNSLPALRASILTVLREAPPPPMPRSVSARSVSKPPTAKLCLTICKSRTAVSNNGQQGKLKTQTFLLPLSPRTICFFTPSSPLAFSAFSALESRTATLAFLGALSMLRSMKAAEVTSAHDSDAEMTYRLILRHPSELPVVFSFFATCDVPFLSYFSPYGNRHA